MACIICYNRSGYPDPHGTRIVVSLGRHWLALPAGRSCKEAAMVTLRSFWVRLCHLMVAVSVILSLIAPIRATAQPTLSLMSQARPCPAACLQR